MTGGVDPTGGRNVSTAETVEVLWAERRPFCDDLLGSRGTFAEFTKQAGAARTRGGRERASGVAVGRPGVRHDG